MEVRPAVRAWEPALRDRKRLIVALLLGAFVAGHGIAADVGERSSRFALTAELRPIAVSACGRFALDASDRHAAEARSADGRYALKAVNTPAVGCDPFPDPIFSNGFEAP